MYDIGENLWNPFVNMKIKTVKEFFPTLSLRQAPLITVEEAITHWMSSSYFSGRPEEDECS